MARPNGSTADGVRRLRVRFSTKRKDDADFLAALDQRCSSDSEVQDFLKRCLLVGFALQHNAGNLTNLLAEYTNKSHYAQTVVSTPSRPGADAESGEAPAPLPAVNGVDTLLGALHGSNKSSAEVS